MFYCSGLGKCKLLLEYIYSVTGKEINVILLHLIYQFRAYSTFFGFWIYKSGIYAFLFSGFHTSKWEKQKKYHSCKSARK